MKYLLVTLLVQLAVADWPIPANSQIDSLAGCDAVLVNDTGIVNSPGFPNNYIGNLNCTWTIFGTAGKNVQLTFTTFVTEPNVDIVKVYDGPSLLSPLLMQHSGFEIPDPVVSSANAMLIQMTTNGATHYIGYRANFTSIIATTTTQMTTPGLKCGGTLLGAGEFATPNYPNYYEDDLECIWHLQSSSQFITLNFTAFDTEPKADYVEVYEGPDTTGLLVYRVAGTPSPLPVLLSNATNLFTVRFTSDEDTTSKGFEAKFY